MSVDIAFSVKWKITELCSDKILEHSLTSSYSIRAFAFVRSGEQSTYFACENIISLFFPDFRSSSIEMRNSCKMFLVSSLSLCVGDSARHRKKRRDCSTSPQGNWTSLSVVSDQQRDVDDGDVRDRQHRATVCQNRNQSFSTRVRRERAWPLVNEIYLRTAAASGIHQYWESLDEQSLDDLRMILNHS